MRVDLAADGIEALDLMRDHNPDPYFVVVLDLQMPRMDGLQLANRIKTDPVLRDTHLVMMSSAGDRREYGSRVAAFAAWLTKPVKPADLCRCLATLPLRYKQDERQIVATSATAHQVSNDVSMRIHPKQPSVEAQGKRPLPQRHSARLLVAEDNPINQKVILHQLARLGYQADTVANGQEALAALMQISYDAVLMDCQMPVMDGYAATKELRKREGTERHTLVIAITAFGLEGDRDKCVEAGMDDYIGKPVRMSQLEEVLARYLDQKRQANTVASNGVLAKT
jgi:CheY-like chemotaxis protein